MAAFYSDPLTWTGTYSDEISWTETTADPDTGAARAPSALVAATGSFEIGDVGSPIEMTFPSAVVTASGVVASRGAGNIMVPIVSSDFCVKENS